MFPEKKKQLCANYYFCRFISRYINTEIVNKLSNSYSVIIVGNFISNTNLRPEGKDL